MCMPYSTIVTNEFENYTSLFQIKRTQKISEQ